MMRGPRARLGMRFQRRMFVVTCLGELQPGPILISRVATDVLETVLRWWKLEQLEMGSQRRRIGRIRWSNPLGLEGKIGA